MTTDLLIKSLTVMNRISLITVHALLFLAIMMMPACSDDLQHTTPSELSKGITLMVPSMPRFSTRAEGAETAANELTYSSLWFFAYPEKGEGTPVVLNLSSAGDEAIDFKNNYKGYTIELTKGKYNLYLVANYNDIYENIQEGDLKNKLIVYQVQNSNYAAGIPNGGIPMSCDNSGFYVANPNSSEGADSGNAAGGASYLTGAFEYDGSSSASLYADLTFACAKITVNANDMHGDVAEISEIKASNLSGQVPLIYKSDYTGYGKLSDANITDATDTPLTFYIPERIVSESSKAEQSSLSLKIGGKTVTLPLGEKPDDKLDVTNPLPDLTDLRKINRGTHYIYTLNEKGEVVFKVEPWSPHQLLYELHGPYFLHLEKTGYQVTAGETTSIWYESDAEIIEVESPVYEKGGKMIPLYNWSVNASENNIKVWVNPEIKSSDFSIIMDDETGKYNYFHIRANNLHKRISVTPLNLKNYLNVTPQNITIDVREQIASGYYNNFFQVMIDTNLPKIKVKREAGWENLPSGEWGGSVAPEDYVIKLTDKNDKRVTSGDEPVDYSNNSEYRLHFSGLNSGKETWKTTRQLTFSVTACDETGKVVTETLEDGTTVELTRTVTINIIPNILNYKIHFRANGWDKPHIYVYQCLEFPSDMPDGKKYLANQPIATNHDGTTAALEYSFTGKIAFKGWNVGDSNNPLNRNIGGKVKGFYYFVDDNSWDPADDNFTQHYYNTMDFCAKHRDEIKSVCQDCGSLIPSKTKGNITEIEGYNRLWPGIMMMNEGNGWWYFELTGVATPGKALIMFSDGHYFRTDNNRYPENNSVGIPLFDFPNREGWLVYNGDSKDRINNFFKQEKPELKHYRLYWPKTFDGKSQNSNIHLWYKVSKNGNATAITEWNKTHGKYENGYYYYDFSIIDDGYLSRQYVLAGENSEIYNLDNFTKLSNFSDNGSGVYCGTLYADDYFKPGVPDPTYNPESFKIGIPLRIRWKSSSANNIHIWQVSNPDKPFGSWPGEGKEEDIPSTYSYRDITLDINCDKIGFLRTLNGVSIEKRDRFLFWGAFKNNYDSSIKRYVYTIE